MKTKDAGKYKWTRHWWTRFGKFLSISFDLLFLEPNSLASWHPTKGNLIDVIVSAWKLTIPKDN